MSSTEEMETKAGHPPAFKVGGMRVPNRTRKNSEEAAAAAAAKATSDPDKDQDSDEQEEDEAGIKGSRPQIVMWGQVRDQHKDYPSQAVQHMQHKPMPTHEPANKPCSAKPNIIQQPRK